MPKNFEDFHSGVGSQSLNMPERQRDALNDMSAEILLANLMRAGFGVNETNLMVTPGNSGMSRPVN